MSSIMSFLNRLLPFATPGTPVLQDLIHLGAICALLYFAPQIQEWAQRRHTSGDAGGTGGQMLGLPGEGLVAEEPEAEMDEPQLGEQQQQPPFPEEGAEDEIDEPHDAGFWDRAQPDDDGPAAGPADAPTPPVHRNVGAKKAKSLARRDRTRAYHEFQRAQGDAQRARDAEGAKEREDALTAERERRKAAEAKLEAKKAQERERKKELERREREEASAQRELAVRLVKRELEAKSMSNLVDVASRVGGDADELWVERILDAHGLLGKRPDGALTMVTSTGWVVRVSREDMALAYQKAAQQGVGDESGRVGYEEFGRLLGGVLKDRSVDAL